MNSQILDFKFHDPNSILLKMTSQLKNSELWFLFGYSILQFLILFLQLFSFLLFKTLFDFALYVNFIYSYFCIIFIFLFR